MIETQSTISRMYVEINNYHDKKEFILFAKQFSLASAKTQIIPIFIEIIIRFVHIFFFLYKILLISISL